MKAEYVEIRVGLYIKITHIMEFIMHLWCLGLGDRTGSGTETFRILARSETVRVGPDWERSYVEA